MIDSRLDNLYTVSSLNLLVREVLEDSVGLIQVRGEISNLATPRSGHIYFSLKDSAAQVRCAMFKSNVNKLAEPVEEGQEVILHGNVSLYPERGDYQIIATHIEPWGLGKLQQAFEALKKRLQAEGLFEKANIGPKYPEHLAIITSHTGAAIQDALSVLKRRWPIAKVTICPTLVQGPDAKENIVKMLHKADKLGTDAILLIRGGGSIEDLWAFNEEVVARAIYHCQTPVISGVGHETDFTIADFVADLRAPTPSVAAESVTPDIQELLAHFAQKHQHLVHAMQRIVRQLMLHCDHLSKRLIHPSNSIRQKREKCSHILNNLHKHIKALVTTERHRFALMQQKLAPQLLKLEQEHKKVNLYQTKLTQLIHHFVKTQQDKCQSLIKQLDTLSPLNTLKRGFSITQHQKNVLTSSKQVKPGDIIHTRLADGTIKSKIQ